MPLRLSSAQPASAHDGREGVPRVGLGHHSVKGARKFTLKFVAIGFLAITLSLFAFQSIYFGAYFRQTENANRLTVLILDLDSAASTLSSSALAPSANTGAYTAVLGPLVVSAAQTYRQRQGSVNSTYWTLGYVFPSEREISTFSLPLKNSAGQIEYTAGVNASEWAMQQVLDQTYWAVVVVNGNATMQALNAVSDGGNTYDPQGSVTFFYEEARNFYATDQYISRQVLELLVSATNQANNQHTLTVLNRAIAGQGGRVGLLTAADPAAVTGAFGYNEHNLRPFDQLGAEAPTTAGAIYLIIFTFLVSLLWSSPFSAIRPKLTAGSEVALAIGVPVLGYCWISLMYSLVSLAFLVDFNRHYGHVGFFVYWMLNWVTMIGLGLVMEFMLAALGQPWFSFFLVFWVIWNVSVAFLSISQQAHFYAYGFAFPVWNNVDGTKSIMLGTKNHLLQNFAVNLAWAISFAIILALWTLNKRARTTRKALQAAEEKAHGKHLRIFL